MHQEAALPVGIPVEDISMFIWRNVHLFDPQFTVLDVAPAILEIAGACAKRLYLGAKQLDSCLEALLHKILMAGFAVDADGFGRQFFQVRLPLSRFMHEYLVSYQTAALFENPKPAEDKIQQDGDADRRQFGKNSAEPHKVDQQFEHTNAYRKGQQVGNDKLDHLKTEKPAGSFKGPAPVDQIAVQHSRHIAADLRQIDVDPQRTSQQGIDQRIDKGVRQISAPRGPSRKDIS